MNAARRALPCLLLVAHAAFAQGRMQGLVVAEPLLGADAGGTTRVHVDPAVPTQSRTLATLADRVANLHVAAGGAGSFGDLIVLRGLSNTPYFSDPSVTVYFDDLPLGSTFSYPTGLFGFASASILRGPQGSAFGRGGEAGVIVLSSAEPGATAAGELSVSMGNFDLRSAAFDVRSARTESMDVSASASFLERDGYVLDHYLGKRLGDQKGYAVAARLRFRPTAGSEIALQLLGHRRRDGEQPLVPLDTATDFRDRAGSTNINFGGVALKAGFDTSLGRLTSTTSRTEWQLMPYENRLFLSSVPILVDSRLEQSQRIWNEELRLASGPKSLVTWHASAWFSDGRTNGDVGRSTPVIRPVGFPPVSRLVEASSFVLNSRSTALFAEATVPPNIGWTVTAGLRLEETKKDFERSQRAPAPPGRLTMQHSFGAVLPKVAASYAFTNETTASASLSADWKPGGWSAFTDNAALASFRSEKNAAFETGVDTSFADKTVTVAVRVFAYRIRDYQIERSFNASDYRVVNAPRARSAGAELEGSWQATPELIVTGSFGYTNVELRSFTDPLTGRSLSGRRAPYVPEYEAHVGAMYRAKNGWFAAAEYVGTGKTYFDESESTAGAAGAHGVFHGRIGYEAARWRVTVYAENLGSADYYTLIVPGVRHAVPGAPCTYGVEAGLKW